MDTLINSYYQKISDLIKDDIYNKYCIDNISDIKIDTKIHGKNFYKKKIRTLLRKVIKKFYKQKYKFINSASYDLRYTNVSYHLWKINKINFNNDFDYFNKLVDNTHANFNLNKAVLKNMKIIISYFDNDMLVNYGFFKDLKKQYDKCFSTYQDNVLVYAKNYNIDYLAIVSYTYKWNIIFKKFNKIPYLKNHSMLNSTVRYVISIYNTNCNWNNKKYKLPIDIFKKILSFIYNKHTVDTIVLFINYLAN